MSMISPKVKHVAIVYGFGFACYALTGFMFGVRAKFSPRLMNVTIGNYSYTGDIGIFNATLAGAVLGIIWPVVPFYTTTK